MSLVDATGPKAKEGIELFTFPSPTCYRISVFLEELKEAYGQPEYTWQLVNTEAGTQKQEWYVALCPNGRVPAIIDHDRGGLVVWESLAILGYLARTYDREGRFSFAAGTTAEHTEAEAWLAWQHAGLGAAQGQANHYWYKAPQLGVRDPYATQRHVGETLRLYGVLEARLAAGAAGRDFVAGAGRGRYSVVDMSMLAWADIATFSGVDLEAGFPNVRAWLARCKERPATRRGLLVPMDNPVNNENIAKNVAASPDAKKQSEEKARFLKEAMEQYGYKYSSP
ncbi:glutathione S-transferase [Xylariomycetidae sp. FL0641]|nr:glutathione S-transferase [Xylariomycetidae sp. FL0641]